MDKIKLTNLVENKINNDHLNWLTTKLDTEGIIMKNTLKNNKNSQDAWRQMELHEWWLQEDLWLPQKHWPWHILLGLDHGRMKKIIFAKTI